MDLGALISVSQKILTFERFFSGVIFLLPDIDNMLISVYTSYTIKILKEYDYALY